MRAHIVIIGAGISGLTAAITIGEGVDKLIAAGETIARPEMTLLDAADWIGGRARTDELSTGVSVDAGAHWFHGGARNPFYKWACDRHYDLGPIGIDTATRRFNVSVEGAVAPEQREWAMNRLYEMYAIWKAQHRDEDVSLRQLADMSKSRVIVAMAEERANNWMAVDSAAKVSSDEFWGDDAGSGGMQLQDGIEKLIAAMTNEARYYKADIQLRRVVQTVKKAGKHFVVVTDKDTVEADYVLSTLSVGALKSHGVRFDNTARSQLDPVLAGMTAAKMTKISCRCGQNSLPNAISHRTRSSRFTNSVTPGSCTFAPTASRSSPSLLQARCRIWWRNRTTPTSKTRCSICSSASANPI